MAIVESYLQGTPCWVDLVTTDVVSAREFYGSLFGWQYDAYPMGPPEAGLTYYMSTLHGKNVAGLMQDFDDAAETDVHWNTYLAVDDADAAAARAVEAGGTLVRPVDEIPGSGRIGSLLDPSGAAIGLWQTTGHIGSAVVNEPGAVIWNELRSGDVASTLPFYEAVAGMETTTEEAEGLGDYTQFFVDGKSIAGGVATSTADSRNAWNIYFAVDDVDASVEKVLALGGAVRQPAFDAGGVGRMAGVTDPQGAAFWLISN